MTNLKKITKYYSPGAFLNYSIQKNPSERAEKRLVRFFKNNYGIGEKDSLKELLEEYTGMPYKPTDNVWSAGLNKYTYPVAGSSSALFMLPNDEAESVYDLDDPELEQNLSNMQDIVDLNHAISPDMKVSSSFDSGYNNPIKKYRLNSKKGGREKLSDHHIGNAVDMGFGRNNFEKVHNHLVKFLEDPKNEEKLQQILLEFRDNSDGSTSNWIHYAGPAENKLIKRVRAKRPTYYIFKDDKKLESYKNKDEFLNAVEAFYNKYYPYKNND